MAHRAKLLDMSGGMLLIPWLHYLAPNITGYKIVKELNVELKELLMVRKRPFCFNKQNYSALGEADSYWSVSICYSRPPVSPKLVSSFSVLSVCPLYNRRDTLFLLRLILIV